MEEIRELVAQAVQAEMSEIQQELRTLKAENQELRQLVRRLEFSLDETEQYSRKSSLILSGDGFPEEGKDETAADTREIAQKVIKEKLKVEIQGGLTACHRLRNRKRVLVKFHDMDDRQKVYQAKFHQADGPSILVHENLTDRRARMVTTLGEMKKKNGSVLNFHTRNGVILARDSRDKQYTRIHTWYTEEEILKVMHDAPLMTQQRNSRTFHRQEDRFLISQTLERIPAGLVMNRAQDLQDFVVPGKPGRQNGPNTRQAARETAVKKINA